MTGFEEVGTRLALSSAKTFKEPPWIARLEPPYCS
jgi:hypothetical protein